MLTMKKKYNLNCIKFKNSLAKHINRIKVGHTVKKIIATHVPSKELLQSHKEKAGYPIQKWAKTWEEISQKGKSKCPINI